MGMLERKLGFLAHNWFKILMALLALAGAILIIVEIASVTCALSNVDTAITAGAANDATKAGLQSGLLFDIGILISLIAIIVAIIISMFHSKKIAGIVLAAGGFIALVLAIISLVVAVPYLNDLLNNATTGANTLKAEYDAAVAGGAPQGMIDTLHFGWQSALYNYQAVLFGNIINIFVFALLPLFFGIKKICKACCKKEAEAPTAK